MVNRRQFLSALGALPAVAATGLGSQPLSARTARGFMNSSGAADDEDFWFEVAQAFTADRSLINLNNGGVSPAPTVVQEAAKRHLDYANSAPPSHALWRVQEPQVEGLRKQMARWLGVDAEELAFTRNSSEGLQICQFGFDLNAGDHVLTTDQDYPRMLQSFRQRELREGIVLDTISLPVPALDPSEIVRRYAAAITDRTRLILVCHVINLTGQILPVREIVALGRSKGIPVIVDGAHSVAHFDFKLTDLDCDYFATSLHKWLFAPHGTGLLYVRRERIGELWPLMAAEHSLREDIRKFEQIGTHPVAQTLAIGQALQFHLGLGPARKEARLRYLRDRWADRLRKNSRVKLLTHLDARFSGGIATVAIDGLDQGELCSWLWNRHKILTCPIGHADVQGLRVSPSVYTTVDEVDRFSEAVEFAMEHGL